MPNEPEGQQPSGESEGYSPAATPIQSTIEQRIVALESKCRSDKQEGPTNKILSDVKTGEWWLIGINGLLLIATIIIACIYKAQLNQMVIATNAATNATCIARKSMELSQKQFAASQAAILQPHVTIASDLTGKSLTIPTNPATAPVGERQWFIEINLINAGKIAATHVGGSIKSNRFGQIVITDVTVPAQSPSYAYQSGFITRRLMIHKGTEPFISYDQFGGTKLFIDLRYFDGTEYIPANFCYIFPHGSSRPDDWQECS